MAEIRSMYTQHKQAATINRAAAALLDCLTNGGLLVRSEFVCY